MSIGWVYQVVKLCVLVWTHAEHNCTEEILRGANCQYPQLFERFKKPLAMLLQHRGVLVCGSIRKGGKVGSVE